MASSNAPQLTQTHSSQEDFLFTNGLYTDSESLDAQETTLFSLKPKSPKNSLKSLSKNELPMVEEEKKDSFKYAEVWKRARKKLRLRNQLKGVQENLQLYGGSVVPLRVTSSGEVLYREILMEAENRTKKQGFGLILPNSRVKRVWSVVYFIMMTYSSLITPFTISFLQEENSSPWLEVNIVMDVLFFCHIIVTCNSAYVDTHQDVIANRRMIVKRYAKFWLFVDMFACLPVYLLPEVYHWDYWGEDYRICRLPRLLRLFHLSSLYQFFSKTRGNYMNELLNIRSSTFRLIAFFVSMSLTTHIVACVWHLISAIEPQADCWVVRTKMLDSGNIDRYIAALHWTVTTLSTVGYGDFVPGTIAERIFALCWMLFAIFFISYAIGCLSEVFDPKVTKENTMIRKLAAMDEFANEAKLSPELKMQLRNAVRVSVESSDLIQTQVQDIFHKDIPIDLRFEISQLIHHKSLHDIPFFRDKEKHFVVMVFPFLEQQFVEEDMSVYCENDVAECLYFIIAGRCAVTVQEEFVVKRLWLGSYFGDIEVFRDIPRQFTVKAALSSELLTMNRRLLRDIRKRFGIIFDEMESIALAKERAWEEAKSKVTGLRDKMGVAHRSTTKEHEEFLKQKRKESMRLSNASVASFQRSALGITSDGTDDLGVLESKAMNTYRLLSSIALMLQHTGFPVKNPSEDLDGDSESLLGSEHDVYESSSGSSGEEDV